MLTRRGLLGSLVLGAAISTTGCVRRDPTVGPGAGPASATIPAGTAATVDPARHAGIQAGLAAAAAAGVGGSQALGDFRPRAARDLAAQAELLSPGVTASLVTASSVPSGFVEACRAATREHLDAPARGILAARLASAAAYAGALASLAEAPLPRVPTEAPSADTLPSPGEAAAMTTLLLQLHPAVQAIEAALPSLAAEDAGWARSVLEGHRSARQVLMGELGRRSLRAPAAEVAYDTGNPTDARQALDLVARVEQAVLAPACGLVRTTGSEELRLLGATVLRDATVAVARSGGALSGWPGWA